MTGDFDQRARHVQERPFDPEIFAEIEQMLGRPRLLELLAVLDREITLRLDPPAREPASLARDAHSLVSSSGALSFQNLSLACAALEQACLTGGDVSARLSVALAAAGSARRAIATLRAA